MLKIKMHTNSVLNRVREAFEKAKKETLENISEQLIKKTIDTVLKQTTFDGEILSKHKKLYATYKKYRGWDSRKMIAKEYSFIKRDYYYYVISGSTSKIYHIESKTNPGALKIRGARHWENVLGKNYIKILPSEFPEKLKEFIIKKAPRKFRKYFRKHLKIFKV